MGLPTSEVGYTSAMPRREDHEAHKTTCGGIGKKKIAKIRFRFPAVVTVFMDPVIRKSRTLTELVYKAHADNQRQLLTLNPAVTTIDGVILHRRCNRSL